MRYLFLVAVLVMPLSFAGCGGDGPVEMTTDFSEEQQKAQQAEDQMVADEEGGNAIMPKGKRKN